MVRTEYKKRVVTFMVKYPKYFFASPSCTRSSLNIDVVHVSTKVEVIEAREEDKLALKQRDEV